MFGIFASIGGKLLGGLLLFSLAAGAYFLWESRVKRSAVIELQRDQLAEAIKAKDEAIADRNRIAERFSSLPVDRLRLCVQRAPTDGCCKPAPAECKP